MELQSKPQLTDIWQKYRTALKRLDWALDELEKRPPVVQQPVVAQLTPLYQPPKPQDPTEFSITSDPTQIKNQRPDDIHKMFIDGTLPEEYYDLILLEERDGYIVSQAKTELGISNPKLHSPHSLESRHPGILKRIAPQADNINPVEASASFGSKYPPTPNKGDVFLRVDQLPTKLFKFNGIKWIELDKNVDSSYAYNDEYIKYLTAMIESGQYDPELLSESERMALEEFLKDD